MSLSGVYLHEAPLRWTSSRLSPGKGAATSPSRPFASASNIHDNDTFHKDDGDLPPGPPAGFRTWAPAGSRSHGPTRPAAAPATSPSHNSSSGGIGRWSPSGARKHEVAPERTSHPYPGEPPLPASGGSWPQLRSPLQRAVSWASPRQSLNGTPQGAGVASPTTAAAAASKPSSNSNLGGYPGASTASPMVAGGASRRWRLSRLGKQVQPTLTPPPPTQQQQQQPSSYGGAGQLTRSVDGTLQSPFTRVPGPSAAVGQQQQQHYQEQEQQRATGGRISPVNGQSAAALRHSRSGMGGKYSDNGDNDVPVVRSTGASDEEYEDGSSNGTLGGYPAAAGAAVHSPAVAAAAAGRGLGQLAPRGVPLWKQGSSPLQSSEVLVSAECRSALAVKGLLWGWLVLNNALECLSVWSGPRCCEHHATRALRWYTLAVSADLPLVPGRVTVCPPDCFRGHATLAQISLGITLDRSHLSPHAFPLPRSMPQAPTRHQRPQHSAKPAACP